MRDIGNKQRLTKFFTHLLVITIIFVLPELLWSLSFPTKPIHPWVYAKALVYILVFYVNYYVIIEKSIGRCHSVLRFVWQNLLLLFAALLVLYLIWRFWGDHIGNPWKIKKKHNHSELVYMVRWTSVFLRDLVMIVLTIGLAAALRLSDKWMLLSEQKKELISAQREEELKNLKSQLNPHFLFNTLNSIYALIAISPDKAQDAVHELSRLLRYVLYDSPTAVTLKQETDFIDNYVKLMRLRLSPSVDIKVDLDVSGFERSMIAPLLFITPIENVFKHGVHNAPYDKLLISIKVQDNMIICRTLNTIHSDCDDKPSEAGGIGMQNLRRRLQLLYGDRANLSINISDSQYEVNLKIPLGVDESVQA